MSYNDLINQILQDDKQYDEQYDKQAELYKNRADNNWTLYWVNLFLKVIICQVLQ
jgi:hypothetical protein